MTQFLFFRFEPVRHTGKSGILGDILDHAGHSFGGSDAVTDAHETCHEVNNTIRNAATKFFGRKSNGFYALRDCAIAFREPNFRKSQIVEFVEEEFKSPELWELYILGQSAWEGEPLYCLDEWVAYVNGSYAGLELAEQGASLGNQQQTIKASIIFLRYAIAVLQAIDKFDREYVDKDRLTQIVGFMRGRVMELYEKSKKFDSFSRQENDGLVAALPPAPKAMIQDVNLGSQSIWSPMDKYGGGIGEYIKGCR